MKIRNIRFFFILISIFVLIGFLKTFYSYKQNLLNIETLAYQQAKILSNYALETRYYYQNLFINHTLELNEQTLPALPAFAALPISKSFSETNPFKITIKTVSDNARNPANKSDINEQKAIDFFKNNKNEVEFFQKITNSSGDYYQYAEVLRTTEVCLKCHSSKETAPKFIQDKYTEAYGYKVGDIRGIISVKIPLKHIDEYFTPMFFQNIFFDTIVLIIFLLIAYGAYRWLDSFNWLLKEEVREKTSEINLVLHSLENYKAVLDESNIVSKTDKNGIITYANEALSVISGYSNEELIGKHHNILRHPDMPAQIFSELWQTIKSNKVWKGIIKNKKKDGGYYYVDVTIKPIVNRYGEILEYIAVRHDITEIIDKKSEIKKLFTTDVLTGLGNRNKLVSDIESLVSPSIAIIDIDRFSNINDFYGNKTGNSLLEIVGQKISQHIKQECMLYRYNADQFVVLCDTQDTNEFSEMISFLLETVPKEHIVLDEKVLSIELTASISFEDKDILLESADMALKEAKKSKKKLLIYNKNLFLEAQYQKNIEWSIKIKKALLEDRIIPFYQPIFNNTTRNIEKYECLVRMMDENGDVVLPHQFLDIAKTTKQYIAVTKKVIEKATETFKCSLKEFAINITIEDILSADLNSYAREMFGKEEFRGRFVLEIVESESIESFDEVTEFIARAKQCGCKIAIDDFGTGYSNFEYLIKLQADYIKIDGSMIKNIDKDKDCEEIVRTIVDFAKKRKLKTIAEFVCSKEVFDKVIELGIDYSQGYYIGKPEAVIVDC